ncbi:phosphatidylserine decarboxylase [Paenibacillus sp. GSMTC-2017]|uniref:archaetidylserine decarboxylase n=1 Tax=Paenibacillus sp. GSMTC-2017 TaxID=2794350 RepID=UPI0018D90801|nr:archaetidylserine decarboxylase [Paenibacillus sp. GSMTC-2017]MBH5317258.1 phosphatidylserine decarboxylase [Paenibacillus sp. GSMTC-2017]
MTKWLLRSMTELSSRKWISRITGTFAQSSASRHFIPRFAKLYGISIEEAEKELAQYRSLNEFFTRRLKPGMRTIHNGTNALVSPVDALITGAGEIKAGTIVNVKGQDYTIEELLNGSPRTASYRNGYYMVLYLSPTDYHRIHVPVTGEVVEREHIKGKVYPVNDFGLRHMKRVLSRNERLITYIKHSCGEAAVVKVGAMNVSSIKYVQPMHESVEKGDELAFFEFGSTIVLVLEDNTFSPREGLQTGMKVKMGEYLGELCETEK